MEDKYRIANGYKHDAQVVYGDTDSVMVRYCCCCVSWLFSLHILLLPYFILSLCRCVVVSVTRGLDYVLTSVSVYHNRLSLEWNLFTRLWLAVAKLLPL